MYIFTRTYVGTRLCLDGLREIFREAYMNLKLMRQFIDLGWGVAVAHSVMMFSGISQWMGSQCGQSPTFVTYLRDSEENHVLFCEPPFETSKNVPNKIV